MQNDHKPTIKHKTDFSQTFLTCSYVMQAAEGIEPIAIRLRAQHLAADLLILRDNGKFFNAYNLKCLTI